MLCIIIDVFKEMETKVTMQVKNSDIYIYIYIYIKVIKK